MLFILLNCLVDLLFEYRLQNFIVFATHQPSFVIQFKAFYYTYSFCTVKFSIVFLYYFHYLLPFCYLIGKPFLGRDPRTTENPTAGEKTDPTVSHSQVRQTPAIHSVCTQKPPTKADNLNFVVKKKRRRKSGLM